MCVIDEAGVWEGRIDGVLDGRDGWKRRCRGGFATFRDWAVLLYEGRDPIESSSSSAHDQNTNAKKSFSPELNF